MTRTHRPVHRHRRTLDFHPHSVTPCILGLGNAVQRSGPAVRIRDRVEKGLKGSRAAARSPRHRAAGTGKAPAGEVLAGLLSLLSLDWIFHLLAAGKGNVSFLDALAALNSKPPLAAFRSSGVPVVLEK